MRFATFLNRSWNAARLGSLFTGTTNFRLPESVRTSLGNIRLTSPAEPRLVWDFINVWLDDEYGLKQLSSRPKAVVDIGANIGLFSLWCGHCFPNARIHAYEPNPRIASYAMANTAAADVSVFREAVGRKAGFSQLVDTGDSRQVYAVGGASAGITVLPLSQVVSRMGGYVDLLKMDCEGAEWEMFKDPQPFQNIAHVRMEYHLTADHTVADVGMVAEALNYRVAGLWENQGFGIVWLDR